MHNKKSQLETFGLIFIIIIVTAAIFFWTFISIKPEQPTFQQYTQSMYAANYLNTLLATHTGMKTIKEYLQECARNPASIDPCSQEPCSIPLTAINTILNNTLNAQNTAYELTIKGPDSVQQCYQFKKGSCTSTKESATVPIPSIGQPIHVTMAICG